MNTPCETVAERVALGEPLSGLTEHVASCVTCKRTVALPSRIAAASAVANHSDPGLGFAARMTIGAQHKLVVRRRRRVVTGAVGGVAAAAVAVFALTRSSTPTPMPPDENKAAIEMPKKLVIESPVAASDSELAGLVRLADTKRATKASAPWGRIRKPLAPYIQLVKGVAP
jgi:hypothetical protein